MNSIQYRSSSQQKWEMLPGNHGEEMIDCIMKSSRLILWNETSLVAMTTADKYGRRKGTIHKAKGMRDEKSRGAAFDLISA